MSPRAIVPMLGQLVDLHLWGRSNGAWWALVSWTLYGNTTAGNRWLHVSGWVPAEHVLQSADPSQQALYRALERVDLPVDSAHWPTPAGSHGRDWHHHGPITEPPAAEPSVSVIPMPPA